MADKISSNLATLQVLTPLYLNQYGRGIPCDNLKNIYLNENIWILTIKLKSIWSKKWLDYLPNIMI